VSTPDSASTPVPVEGQKLGSPERRDSVEVLESLSVPIHENVSINGDAQTNGTNEEEHVTSKVMPPVTAKENKQNGKKRNEGKTQNQQVNGGRGKNRKNRRGVCNGNGSPPEEGHEPASEPPQAAEVVEPATAAPLAAAPAEAPKAPPRRKKWLGRHGTKERAPTPGRDLTTDATVSDESNLSWSSSSDDSVVAALSDRSASSVEDDTVIFRPPTVTARASVEERLTSEVADESRVPVHPDEPQAPLGEAEPEQRVVAEGGVRGDGASSATPDDLPQEPVAGPIGGPLHITVAVTRWLYDQNVEQVLLTDVTGSSSSENSDDDQDKEATRSSTGPKNGFRNPFPASSHKCSRGEVQDDGLRKRVAQKTDDSGSESGTDVWDASRLCDPTLFVAKYYRLGDEHGGGGSGSEAGSGSVVMALELRTSPDEVSWAEESSWPVSATRRATLPKTATVDSGIHSDESSDEQTPQKSANGCTQRGRTRRPKTPARALLNQLKGDGSFSCGGICCVIQ